jgi:hypothetical protein
VRSQLRRFASLDGKFVVSDEIQIMHDRGRTRRAAAGGSYQRLNQGPDPPSRAQIALRQSEQLPKSNEKKLPFGLMCSTTFTIPYTPPLAVRMTNLSVLVNAIGSLTSGS